MAKLLDFKNITVGFIGAGNMTEALIKGVINQGLFSPSRLLASDVRSQRKKLISRRYKIRVTNSNRIVCQHSEVIILAVKPQDAGGMLKEIAGYVNSRQLLISIIAGFRTDSIQKICSDVSVIRVMPNTPALVGKGISAFCLGKRARKTHSRIARKILGAVGVVIEVNEKLMDAVTALSGSGPAYFFYLIEALTEAGQRIGFSKKTAFMLAAQTALGSAELLMQTGLPPEELRRRVTSKGGTTEAGLKILEKERFKQLVGRAVIAARNRSKGLSKYC